MTVTQIFVTQYQCDDGAIFDKKEDAILHEEYLNSLPCEDYSHNHSFNINEIVWIAKENYVYECIIVAITTVTDYSYGKKIKLSKIILSPSIKNHFVDNDKLFEYIGEDVCYISRTITGLIKK